MSRNTISRRHTKFCESDSLTTFTQGPEGPRRVQKDVQQELDIDFGINQTFRPLVVSHLNSCTSSPTNSVSSTVADTVCEVEEIVSN